jgi:hypothetical protein
VTLATVKEESAHQVILYLDELDPAISASAQLVDTGSTRRIAICPVSIARRCSWHVNDRDHGHEYWVEAWPNHRLTYP